MNIEENDTTITLTRMYNAPKDLVFGMFQNPLVSLWWGPESWPLTDSDMDFVPGGTWHYGMVGPDGTEVWSIATYEEIDAPNKIVYRDAFSNADGDIDETRPKGHITITFDETAPNQTKLTLQATYASPEQRQQIVAMGMIEGMKDTWSQLDTVLTVKMRVRAQTALPVVPTTQDAPTLPTATTPPEAPDTTTLQVR